MITHNPKQLAMLVKNHRKQQKLTQSSVADQVGLKQTTISAFESKPEATKLDTLFRILAATNLEIHIRSKDAPRNQNDWHEEW